MFLKERATGHLLAVLNAKDLFDPYTEKMMCRGQCGEEEQDPEFFNKTDLIFLSDEELPKCWLDPHYRDAALSQRAMLPQSAKPSRMGSPPIQF